ncbi:cohesin-associated protein Pds5 [Rhodotorula toruloides]|uniref:Cohesin-associated protein Pds5 n=1 Tax=Rhodotorula toruloides TaxID=5286 RepID=A0A511KKD8_RHOTO|nr:cohesin-associated protein Pds5 [Rhodotorula toruloides]
MAKQRLAASHTLQGAQSTTDLAKRLKAIHEQLSNFDQDDVDTNSLDKVARQLIDPKLLLHKDKGVKAYVGACLVDVLRLYAPEAPYTPAELTDIFDFLVRQLKHVGSPSDPHQAEYFYIVDSLASVKSIVLVCDLDAADDLMERVFRMAFDTVSSNSPKNVELALLDILLALLEEVSTVPSSVLDVLTAQFLPRASKSRSSAFRLAVEVARGASDKLQRYVSQYFGETIVAVLEGGTGGRAKGRRKGRKGAANESEDESEESVEEAESDASSEGAKGARGKRKAKTKAQAKLKDGRDKSTGRATAGGADDDDLPSSFVEAHDLIRSINRHVPSLLLNVIPQLAEELTTNTPAYRKLATTTLGQMFGEPIGHGDLAKAFPGVWQEWLRRSRDLSVKVRIAFCERLGKVWKEHPELVKDIEAHLQHYLLVDTDDKVRLAACQIFDALDYETASHHAGKNALLTLAERTRDKKEKVRAVAFKALGKLYNFAFPDIESHDEHATVHFGWIPGVLLDGLAFTEGTSVASSATQRHLVTSTFLTSILPLPSSEKDAEDPASWTDRFLLVEKNLKTPTQRAALMSLTRLEQGTGERSVWEAYVKTCERYNSGIIDDKDQVEPIKGFLKKVIQAIAAQIPESKASDDLYAFAKNNVQQLYRELRTMLDPQTDLKTFVKNERDLFRRLDKQGESMVTTFTAFVRFACLTFVNRSSVPQLLKRLQQGAEGKKTGHDRGAAELAQAARRVLVYISKNRPALYKSHVAKLSKLLADGVPGELERGDGASEAPIDVCAVVLHALAKLKMAEPSVAIDSKLSKKALQFARQGNAVQAKQAATLLALDSGRPGVVGDLVEHLSQAVETASKEQLVSHFAALARLARYSRDSFDKYSEAITTTALQTLTKAGIEGEEVVEGEATWFDTADLPATTRARLLSIKILTNRCLAYVKTDSAAKVSKPVFDLLWPLLQQFGGEDTPPVASHIRLACALAILKLAASAEPAFVKSVLQHFDELTRLVQDTTFEVREGFLRKLLFYLRHGRFPRIVLPRFNMMLFLIGHEPEVELKESILTYARSRKRLPDNERQALWEQPFLRLIHLLAHHPDLDPEVDHVEPETVKFMARYLDEYIDIFATSENVSYLYHLAQKVKTVRDKQSPVFDKNLYLLSELSQHLLKRYATRHSWPIPTYPKQASLPTDIFAPLGDSDEVKKVLKTTFLDEDMLGKIEDRPEKKKPTGRKRVSTAAANGESKPKRAKTTQAGSSTAKKRGPAKGKAAKKAKKEWDSDAEDSPEEESDAEEEEDDDDESEGEVVVDKKGKKPERGQRGGLRSDPGKKLEKGIGAEGSGTETETEEQVDEDADEMDVDGEAPANKKGKAKASPAKKTVATPKKKSNDRVASSSSAKRGGKGKKASEDDEDEVDDKPRKALRGLKQPRKMKTADLDAISDVGDTDDEEMDTAEEGGSD